MTASFRRSLPRLGLACVLVVDLVSLFVFLGDARPIGIANGTLHAFDDLVSTTAVRGLVVLIGVVGAVAFASKPGRLWQGMVPLAALALLSTAHAQLFGSPWRHLYYSGLCLSGWLLGLAVVRRRGVPGDESYARTGGVALLSAAYLNAGISKLVYGGSDWLSGLPIQEVVVGQDGLVADGMVGVYRSWVVSVPAVVCLFSVVTVGFELAAPLMLVGRRTRAAIAIGLFAMHANIYVLTGILYWESMVLLVLFAAWADTPPAETAPGPAAEFISDRTFVAGGALLLSCAVVAIGHQGRRFAASQAAQAIAAGSSLESASPGARAPSLRHVGPYEVGERLAEGWKIESVEIDDGGILAAVSGTPGRAVFEVTCAASEHRSPFDLGSAHIFYSSDVAFGDLEAVGSALRAKTQAAARGPDVCGSIAEWRKAARAAEPR
jgi:hypothetical protein